MLDAKKRVAMVTGASRGIGKAIVEKLAAAGFRVSAGVRTPEKFEDTEQVIYRHYDAMVPETAQSWIDETIKQFNEVNTLVNVAGISKQYGYFSEDESALDEMWAVNVKAPVRLTRLVLPHLKANGSGRVVNVVSVSGKTVRLPINVGYGITKHGMMAATVGLRRDAWDDGVRATAVCPGLVATDMTAPMGFPMKDMTQPEDLAEIIKTILLLPNSAGVPELIVDTKNNW